MLIPPEALIDGVVRALLEAVLPEVGPRPARAQLYCAVDILRHLRDRLEERPALLQAEADSAAAGLERMAEALRAQRTAEALRAAGAPGDAAAAAADAALRALAGAPEGPPVARAAALRAALGDAVAALHALPPDAARAAHAEIARHLSAQARRDAALAKPSMLAEISRGRAPC